MPVLNALFSLCEVIVSILKKYLQLSASDVTKLTIKIYELRKTIDEVQKDIANE